MGGFRQRYARTSVTETSVAAALSATLDRSDDTGGAIVEVHVESSAAATFTLEVSFDGVTWRTVDTMVIGVGGGANHQGFFNAYPMIRVSTPTANNNVIEIVAGSF